MVRQNQNWERTKREHGQCRRGVVVTRPAKHFNLLEDTYEIVGFGVSTLSLRLVSYRSQLLIFTSGTLNFVPGGVPTI